MKHPIPSPDDSRADDKGIEWGKLVLEYEPADGPVGDVSDYSDIRDISKIRDTQEYKDELLTKE